MAPEVKMISASSVELSAPVTGADDLALIWLAVKRSLSGHALTLPVGDGTSSPMSTTSLSTIETIL